jgi:beta-lactamase class A
MFEFKLLREKKVLFLTILFFGLGFLTGLPIDGALLINKLFNATAPKEWREGQKGLINPLLGVNFPDKTIFDDLNPIQNQFTKLVESEISSNRATKISIYFKDQSTSHWTGVNEKDLFAPASLVKIPMMMTYFKVAESNPAILNKTIQYLGPDENTIEAFKPSKAMIIGQYYTVSDLIERMIIYSDNNAISLLFNNMNKNTLGIVFSDLSITLPADINQPGDYISPGNFSRFFRTLYNSTYLNEEYSQKALDILSRVDFKQGLVAGVPNGITVAHKFGETPDVDQKGQVAAYELHDCGIVYYPGHPYILCVMTKGPSYDSLKNVIKDISLATYQNIESLYKYK